ncbi:hypothetical protein EVA_20852, partial [gut metagenome]
MLILEKKVKSVNDIVIAKVGMKAESS